ncbi:Glycerol dehydrogenase and related enzymes [Richelia intracellularis HM01]|uniref:DUF3119 family protein n=1 Tax=Richelia intracellularis TaxID=1164990 RepID=UPI0002B53B0C|nr:DUF3119 family protein [Richelia intracellularis]CCH65025.1 Glycerol dehydrogenase and related enzymes [Richelia intracellularis HM01]
MPTSLTSNLSSTVELRPNYKISIYLALGAIPSFFLQLWIGGVLAFLSLFLLFQALTVRLQFTPTDLDIYRGKIIIRRFPYEEWQNWRIFWYTVPILFYFKEIKSIHFLPILFDPTTLKECLEQHCPRI